MRKNMIFGMIGFVLAVVTCGQALAALGPGEISMGVFSIPLPADGKDACRVWLDKQSDSTLTCDDFFASLKGDPGSPGDDACYPVYSYTGWGTSSFQLNIKWCCDSGAVDCQEMTNSYPVENAYTNYYNAWLAQYCSVVFDTTPIENGYQVISKNPCTGEEETYNITGEVGQSANIVSVTPSYTPYPQSTNDGDNPEKQGYMTLTIEYISGPNSVHTTPDPCEIHTKQYTSGEHEGEYYSVKVCHDAQGSSLAESTPVYNKGGSYEFAYDTPDGTLGLADLANKIPLTTENKYKGPDISNRKIGYKYVLETYPDGMTREINKEFDQPEEVIEYIENNGVVTTNTGKRYTCGGKDTNTVCTNSGVKYCFELSASTGSVCDNAISVGAALDNEFNGTTGDYLYHGPNVSARTKGYLYKVLTHGSGRVEEVDKKEDECDPVVGTTSAADSTLKTGQRCKCGGMTSSAPCNVANGTYLLGVYGEAQDLLSVMQNQVQVKIKMFGTTLYYCSGSATCCDANQTPGEGDFATCWTSVNIAGLHGDNGASCLATKSGSDWYICCSPSYTGDDCNKVIDDDIIAMLNGMMCQVNYTHKYLHDDGNGGFTANTTKDGARGERVIVTNSCNDSTENLDTYYGEDGPAGDDYNPCDGLTAGSTAALTTVRNTTNVYVPHGNGLNGTTTGIGYYTETNVMCDTSGNKIVKKYDKCDPVSLASGASRTVGGKTCSGNQTLLMCTPQEGDLTPYPFCSDAEVSGYPKLEYVQPSESNDKFTAEGYTRWVHKYIATGSEVVGDVNRKDPCHPVYKLSRTNSNNTVTATTSSVQKCQIQSPGTTGFTAGEWYCLNTTDNVAASCNGYSDTISDSETSILKYHLPIMDGTTPTGAGYTYYEVKDGNNVTVRERIEEKDKCEEKILGRNASSNINNSAVVTQCTVVAQTGTPGLDSTYAAGTKYCLNYANGTCPGGLTDIGSAIDAAADAETDPCADVAPADKAKTVKSTTVEQTARSNSAPRTTTTTRTMCAGDPQVDINYEKCKPVIPTPVGKTCSNGVWMQCSGSASGEPDGYCETNAVITYVAPVVNDGIPGYLHTVITRNGQTTFVNDQGDKCEPVIGSVTTRASQSTTVYSGYKCTCGGVGGVCGRAGDMYYLGDIVGHESDATFKDLGQIYEQASESDPCTGLDSEDAAKTVKKTEYEYVAKGATGNNTGVGYVKKTKVMCDDTLTVPHKEEEILYDTCEAVKNDNTCLTIVGPNYQCYNQTKNVGDSERAYKTCNPNANVDSILVANKIDEKLNKDITFEVKQNSQDGNKDYITITGTNMTDKPVVALETLQGQSVFDIWKEEQTENTKCQALFDKNCSELTTSDMLLDLSAQGTWARSEYGKNSSLTHADLEADDFQESLKPCKNFDIQENSEYSGNDGKQYVMTCVE